MVPISNSGTPGFLFHIYFRSVVAQRATARRQTPSGRPAPSTHHTAPASRFNALRRKDAKQEQFRFVLRI